jgi:GT2 family glycosyltransferase
MEVSIVIPNYNGEKYIETCLKSVFNQDFADYEVVVVDNASKDKSPEMIQKQYSEVIYIQNKENYGFAKAVNQGIKQAKGKYVVLLNNDVEVEVDWLRNLYQCINRDENIFGVSSKMLQFYERDLIDDAGDNYNILGWANKIGDGDNKSRYNKSAKVFSACAGAAIYRKSVFDEIGMFDEDFFAYMEDVDIGYRARIYGYYNMFCSDAIVYHIGSATSGSKYNEFKIKLAARNNLYVVYKNMPLLQLLINLPFLVLGEMIKMLFFVKKGYGKIYFNGKKEGIIGCRKIQKVPYKRQHSLNYINIEVDLISNAFKYIYRFLKKLKT